MPAFFSSFGYNYDSMIATIVGEIPGHVAPKAGGQLKQELGKQGAMIAVRELLDDVISGRMQGHTKKDRRRRDDMFDEVHDAMKLDMRRWCRSHPEMFTGVSGFAILTIPFLLQIIISAIASYVLRRLFEMLWGNDEAQSQLIQHMMVQDREAVMKVALSRIESLTRIKEMLS